MPRHSSLDSRVPTTVYRVRCTHTSYHGRSPPQSRKKARLSRQLTRDVTSQTSSGLSLGGAARAPFPNPKSVRGYIRSLDLSRVSSLEKYCRHSKFDYLRLLRKHTARLLGAAAPDLANQSTIHNRAPSARSKSVEFVEITIHVPKLVRFDFTFENAKMGSSSSNRFLCQSGVVAPFTSSKLLPTFIKSL